MPKCFGVSRRTHTHASRLLFGNRIANWVAAPTESWCCFDIENNVQGRCLSIDQLGNGVANFANTLLLFLLLFFYWWIKLIIAGMQATYPDQYWTISKWLWWKIGTILGSITFESIRAPFEFQVNYDHQFGTTYQAHIPKWHWFRWSCSFCMVIAMYSVSVSFP